MQLSNRENDLFVIGMLVLIEISMKLLKKQFLNGTCRGRHFEIMRK